MGDAKMKKVTTPKIKDAVRNFLEYHVQINNATQMSIKTQGNSGTAIPTYQVLWLGTGKKLTREKMKRISRRINRIKVLFFEIYD